MGATLEPLKEEKKWRPVHEVILSVLKFGWREIIDLIDVYLILYASALEPLIEAMENRGEIKEEQ